MRSLKELLQMVRVLSIEEQQVVLPLLTDGAIKGALFDVGEVQSERRRQDMYAQKKPIMRNYEEFLTNMDFVGHRNKPGVGGHMRKFEAPWTSVMEKVRTLEAKLSPKVQALAGKVIVFKPAGETMGDKMLTLQMVLHKLVMIGIEDLDGDRGIPLYENSPVTKNGRLSVFRMMVRIATFMVPSPLLHPEYVLVDTPATNVKRPFETMVSHRAAMFAYSVMLFQRDAIEPQEVEDFLALDRIRLISLGEPGVPRVFLMNVQRKFCGEDHPTQIERVNNWMLRSKALADGCKAEFDKNDKNKAELRLMSSLFDSKGVVQKVTISVTNPLAVAAMALSARLRDDAWRTAL